MPSGKPSRVLMVLEAQRALGEALMLPGAAPLLAAAPRGDGHPVLVLPGFLAGDRSTRILRRFLDRKGYAAHAWKLGLNRGPVGALREKLLARVVEITDAQERSLSIVGWSLGGIYARELAKSLPDRVRSVVTLGSPFADAARPTHASGLYQRWTGGPNAAPSADFVEALRDPPPVPSTALFSRTDGVVHWSSCLEPESARTESIEVPGSHCGLGANALVLYALADRLSQADGDWAPFDRTGWRQWCYGTDVQRPGAASGRPA